MDGTLKIGLWQSAGRSGDVAANLAEIRGAALQAAGQGVDLLVFPECFLTGYYSDAPIAGVAAQVTQGVRDTLAALSAETGTALVVGSYEPAGGAIRNSAFAFTPGGGHVATYAKRALFGAWEREVFAPGTGPAVFDVKGLRCGLLICYDIEFPERVRELAQLGAEAILCPTALMEPYDTVPRHIVPARAFENHVFVAYANRIGQEGPFDFMGQSRVAGPMGNVLAAAGREAALVTATLDPADRDRARADYDYLQDLRSQMPI